MRGAPSQGEPAVVTRGRVRAIIFDFDGVLADTEALHCAAFRETAAAHGLVISERDYFNTLLGLPDRACLAEVWARADQRLSDAALDALVAEKRARYAAVVARAGLYPGIPDLLARMAPHFVLAVASGAYRDEIEAVLVGAGVRERFAAVIGAEEVRLGKPAPDPFLAALAALNAAGGATLTPAECLVIEDSPHGVTAARLAGMRCIAVTTNHAAATLAGADHIVDDITRLQPEELHA